MRTRRILQFMGVSLLLLASLSACGSQSTAKTSTTVSTSTAKSNSKKQVLVDLKKLPLNGIWKSENGSIFTFKADGTWIYQTSNAAKTSGTYRLAGAYGKSKVLLKIHGLDEDIGNIGNYLGVTFSGKKKELNISGFGQFTLQETAANLTDAVRLSAAFNAQPSTLKQLLTGTWMNTDETSENKVTTNFDANGEYQRYFSTNSKVEKGHYQVEVDHKNKSKLIITYHPEKGQKYQVTYIRDSDTSQLTAEEHKIKAVYIKNQMPD